MKKFCFLSLLFILAVVLTSCVASGPAITKSDFGNLEINVWAPSGINVYEADIYLDGIYIGNPSAKKPVLYARHGLRQIRVEAPGAAPYSKEIHILGDPNHQVLNVQLQKK